jgi:hypothetical protein
VLSDGLVEGYIADSVAMLHKSSTLAECDETMELLLELLRGYGACMTKATALVQVLVETSRK